MKTTRERLGRRWPQAWALQGILVWPNPGSWHVAAAQPRSEPVPMMPALWQRRTVSPCRERVMAGVPWPGFSCGAHGAWAGGQGLDVGSKSPNSPQLQPKLPHLPAMNGARTAPGGKSPNTPKSRAPRAGSPLTGPLRKGGPGRAVQCERAPAEGPNEPRAPGQGGSGGDGGNLGSEGRDSSGMIEGNWGVMEGSDGSVTGGSDGRDIIHSNLEPTALHVPPATVSQPGQAVPQLPKSPPPAHPLPGTCWAVEHGRADTHTHTCMEL